MGVVETGFLCVALVPVLDLALVDQACLCLPSAGIKGVHYHRLAILFRFCFCFWRQSLTCPVRLASTCYTAKAELELLSCLRLLSDGVSL